MKSSTDILAFMLFAFSMFAAATDTLVMRDGTMHSGTFVSATSTTITFRQAKTIHREGDRWYGKTKHGQYLSKQEAVAAGIVRQNDSCRSRKEYEYANPNS